MPTTGTPKLVGAFLFIVIFAVAVSSAAAKTGTTDVITATATGAVITNGTVMLGVNATGSLNYNCVATSDPVCPAPSASVGTGAVGLRYVPLNTDGTAPGCLCEGWGMADAASGLTGYANEARGDANITVNSFVADGTARAVSDVTIADAAVPDRQMRVVQDYHPSAASPNLYENTVTVTNTGTVALTDVRYRRVMDWDVEPTPFAEWSTIQGSSPQLLFDSDDGFATSNPLAGPSYINSEAKCGASYTGPCAFKDLGAGGEYPAETAPGDIGALFDFGFGSLAVGESKTFRVFYGAAPDETAALAAIAASGAEVYSLGQPSCPVAGVTVGDCETLPANAGVEQGKPNTFIFAFVTTAGDLSITKADSPDPVSVDGNLTYTLTVRNNGPDPVTAVQVQDTLPAGVTHVSTTTTRGSCTGTTTITCSLGTMPNGQTDTITIVVKPTAPGTLTNTATVSSPSSDVNLSNNTSTATTTVNPVVDLALQKSDAPDPVTVGNDLTYTLTVTNAGPSPATGVVISDPLPAGATFVSASPGCNLTGTTVTCTIGALAKDGSETRTITVRPTVAGTLTNSASTSANESDSNGANNVASTSTTVNPATGTAADLRISKSDDPDPVLLQGTLTYRVTVTNDGPDAASGVVVTDTLPSGVTFVSADAGCTFTAPSTVTCSIGALSVAGVATRDIVVRPNATGSLTNTASVASGVSDPNTSNNTATATTTVRPAADLTLTKTDSPDPVTVGSDLTYTLTVSNAGPSDAEGVTITDPLPAGVTFVSAEQGCAEASGVVTCTIGSVSPGTPVTRTIVVRPTAAGSLTNAATASTSTADPTPSAGNHVATATTTVNPILQTLSVSKAGAGAGTVTSSPAGIDCGATCIASFVHGTVVTLTAAPAAGSTFGGFTGCDSATGNTCTVTMNAARSVTATFNVVVVTPPANRPPDCSRVTATPNILWPPNNRFRVVTLAGATDPDGNPLTFSITGVTQDEAVKKGPDAQVANQPNRILLRADRRGGGNGRIYRIAFTVSDGTLSCTGVARVGVPHDRATQTPIDSGGNFNSFAIVRAPRGGGGGPPRVFTDFFTATGQFKVHSIPVTADIATVEIKIKWRRAGDRFDVKKVRLFSGRRVIGRGPNMVDQRAPRKLRITTRRSARQTTVRISNLAPGKLRFNVTASKLRFGGRTAVRTEVRRVPG